MKVMCLICGVSFSRIGNHLPKHHITIDEYRARFPGAETCAYKHTSETLSKMRGPRPSIKGIPKSEEHKQKLSKWRTGRTFAPHSPETIAKMRDAWERRKANKEKYEQYVKSVSDRMSSPEMLIILRNRFAGLISDGNHNGKSKDTKIEQRFQQYLGIHNIKYEHQYILNTRKGAFTFDFLLVDLNLLVEVDGEYWHSKSLEVWNRDVLKTRLAEEQGYTVARISDKDWKPDIIHASLPEIASHSRAILERRHTQLTQKAV